MATSQAANLVETAIGHTGEATTEQNVSNPARDRQKYADPSGETMKALVWMGKNSVEVVNAPKPRILEDTDVIVKVTGSTVLRKRSTSSPRRHYSDAERRHPWT